jgi:hypothetical protein
MPGFSDQRLGREDHRKKDGLHLPPEGSAERTTVIVILPDRGDRYHPPEVFRSICHFLLAIPILSS